MQFYKLGKVQGHQKGYIEKILLEVGSERSWAEVGIFLRFKTMQYIPLNAYLFESAINNIQHLGHVGSKHYVTGMELQSSISQCH